MHLIHLQMVISSRGRPWALWKRTRWSWPLDGITWNKWDWKQLNANWSSSIRGFICPNTGQGISQAKTADKEQVCSKLYRSQWPHVVTKYVDPDIIVGYKMLCPIKNKSEICKSFACHPALRISPLMYYVWFWA